MSRRKLSLQVGKPNPDDVLICMPATIPPLRPENVTLACSDCGTAIQKHPTSPDVPRKVCTDCGALLPADGLKVTREQIAFVRLHRWRGGTKH